MQRATTDQFDHGSHGARSKRHDALLQRLASQRRGVVTRGELLAAGLSPGAIDWCVLSGRLVVVHRGIYHVPSLATSHTRFVAALVACGEATSHICRRSATALLELLPPPLTEPVDVIVRIRGRGRVVGVRASYLPTLPEDETTSHDGIPVTTPARTVLDIAGLVSVRELEQAMAVALQDRGMARAELDALLERYPRHRGSGTLRALLRARRDFRRTRSQAEEALLALLRRADIEEPAMNVVVAGFEVDGLWQRQRLIVEVDGYAHHSSQAAFQRDRSRTLALTAAGYRVIRVTWEDIMRRPEVTAKCIALALLHTDRPLSAAALAGAG
jgi:very-short-patch-repair endonuclease